MIFLPLTTHLLTTHQVYPKSCCWGLNPGPRPYQGRALPLSYSSLWHASWLSSSCSPGPARRRSGKNLQEKRVMGIEPTRTCLEGRCSAFELHPHTFFL